MSNEDAIAAIFRAEDAHGWLRPVAESLGLGSGPFTAVLHKVHHRPGVDVSAGYSIMRGEAERSDAYVVATTADVPSDARVAHVRVGGATLSVWRHPHDPYLPGLAAACDADVVSLWVDTSPVHVTMSAYRPIRRAVLRYEAPGHTWFAKVVRPSRLADLAHRQNAMAEAGLSPQLLGTPAPGTMLMDPAPGISLAKALSAALAGDGAMPSPWGLIDVLERLPDSVLAMRHRPSWVDHLDFHSRAAASAQPSHRREIETVAGRIRRILDREPVSAVAATHGDFYEANVFVEQGSPRQLIDLDALGPGLREDDLACMLGHLAVLPALSPRHFGRLGPVVDDWAAVFESTIPSATGLRARVAAVALSLVAGAGADQGVERLAVVREWLERARGAPRSG